MIKVKIADNKVKEVEIIKEDKFLIDSKEYIWDIEPISDTTFHVIMDNRNYLAEIMSVDENRKEMILKINGKTQKVIVKDKYDILLDSLGMSSNSSKKVKELKAPMPGLVIDVMAKEKIKIEKGSTLLILEAMKMENAIKSPDEVVIKKVHVKAGETVEKNQVLVTFD